MSGALMALSGIDKTLQAPRSRGSDPGPAPSEGAKPGQSGHLRLPNPTRQYRLLVGLLTALILALSYAQWPQALDTSTYQLAARLIPAEADVSRVAYVELGDQTRVLNYDHLAQTVRALQTLGVQALGIHLPLDQPQSPANINRLMQEAERRDPGAPDPRWLAQLDRDTRLATTLNRHGGVVLAALPLTLSVQPAESTLGMLSPVTVGESAWHAHPWLNLWMRPPAGSAPPPLSAPLSALATAAVGVGAALPATDRQGVILALDDASGARAGFLLPLLALSADTPRAAVLEPGRGLRLGTELIPLGPDMSAHVLPPRRDLRRGGVERLSIDTVINAGPGTERLAGRTVILGPGVTRGLGGQPEGAVPDALWQTYVLGSLLNGSWVQVPAWFHGMERLLLVLAGLYLLAMPMRLMDRPSGLLVTVLLAVVIFNAGLLVLLVRQIWLPVTLPVVALLTSHALLWVWLNHARRLEQDRREADKAHRELGNLLRTQGQLEAAFTQFRQVRQIDEDLKEALYQLGHDLVRRRQYGQAREVYGHLEWISPRYRDVLVRIERLKGLSKQNRPRLGPEPGTADQTLIVDGETLEKPTLGRYQIECQLGRGSMGVVYLGVDPKIGRKVAIKTLALNQEFEQEMLEQVKWRFFREAEASGRLNHRNIVTIYDVGEEHDLAFIAMDYLEGSSLDAYTRRETLLPVDEVLDVCAQVAEALAYAHGQRVIHRDVKPANIIYDRSHGSVKITDFGIACLTDNNRTRTGTILGTPAFMSPEQVSGKDVDGRSDLFALGVTLYQLLTAELPFTADTMAGLVYQITQTRHQSLSELRPELGPLVALIVNKALEKEADKRYQTGTEMAKALRDCAIALKRSPRSGQFSNPRVITP
ncbi:protein kinase domain-containing protein [Thioalkalivibrio sulfidiphilus]|uniref:protein kinase domain-containing protein n=1 Tax=Thioalkalivibrio sulfidiphilus TaxID=1033854 RepID=UPI003B2B44AE